MQYLIPCSSFPEFQRQCKNRAEHRGHKAEPELCLEALDESFEFGLRRPRILNLISSDA